MKIITLIISIIVISSCSVNDELIVHVDADNNNGTDLPDQSNIEQKAVEEGFPKMLRINTPDTDKDGIPNFADFDPGLKFVPLVIEVPKKYNSKNEIIPIDLKKSKLTLSYNASDSTRIQEKKYTSGKLYYKPASGYLRFWKTNGNTKRNPSPLLKGGDYLPSDVKHPLYLFTINEANIIIVYIEAVRDMSNPDHASIDIKIEDVYVE